MCGVVEILGVGGPSPKIGDGADELLSRQVSWPT